MNIREALSIIAGQWGQIPGTRPEFRDEFLASVGVGLLVLDTQGYEVNSFLPGDDADKQYERDFGPEGVVPRFIETVELTRLVNALGGKVPADLG